MQLNEIESILEGILFASGEAVSIDRISSVLGVNTDDIIKCAENLSQQYSRQARGVRLVKMENFLQLCSAPEHGEIITKVLETRPLPKLSKAALEVLAITAYFQPVTRAYIDQVRGIDSAYTVGLLVDRGLIEACGRLDVPGRPSIYKTTALFLRTMGVESLEDLPTLPELSADDGQAALQLQIKEIKEKESEKDLKISELMPETDKEA